MTVDWEDRMEDKKFGLGQYDIEEAYWESDDTAVVSTRKEIPNLATAIEEIHSEALVSKQVAQKNWDALEEERELEAEKEGKWLSRRPDLKKKAEMLMRENIDIIDLERAMTHLKKR
jgi:hypothetical protein